MSQERQSQIDLEKFDDYMLDSLQRSSNYAARLEQRTQQAVNFFLVLLTALVGIGLIAIVDIQDIHLRNFILSIDLTFIAGFGVMTFTWILSTKVQAFQEATFQYFFHRYFRDKNPEAFDKYGISELLVWYKRATDRNYSPSLQLANNFSLLVLGVFNCIVFALVGYFASQPLTGSYIIDAGLTLGAAILFFQGIVWIIARRFINKYWKSSQSIIARYHSDTEATDTGIV